MNRMSLSLAGSLAAALVFSAVPAQAAVTAKDAPSQADIIQAFPELAGAQFSTDKVTAIGIPGAACDESVTMKVKSGRGTNGTSATVYPIVVTAVVEFKSVAKAKAYMSKYKKYVKNCRSYVRSLTGDTVTLTKAPSPRLGDESLAFSLESGGQFASFSSSAIVRDDKRVGFVSGIDDAGLPTAAVKQLAKVAAKKMK